MANETKMWAVMELTNEELHLIRQWFGHCQDTAHPDYLEIADYQLAKRIIEQLDMRVPNSVSCKLKG